MRGDFDEDEDPDFEPDPSGVYDDDDMCIDCQRIGSHWDLCGVCGATMCAGCFETGCGVCKGPHR
jgi:hypothetical protein